MKYPTTWCTSDSTSTLQTFATPSPYIHTMSPPQKPELGAILAALSAHNVTSIEIEYSGQGDEGDIDDVEFYATSEDGTLSMWDPPAKTPDAELYSTAHELFGNFAYERLEKLYSGWENNEGARGTISIDLVANTVAIEHGEPDTTYNYTHTESPLL